MALFDLDAWADELVESYSHGMRQKLIISSAFIHRPEVIVVDEPMVGLDPKAARILKDLFREYVRRGHTIMMSTHTLEVAEALCDRIAIIQHGKIRAVGTIQDLRGIHTRRETGEIFLKLTGELAARAEVMASPGCWSWFPAGGCRGDDVKEHKPQCRVCGTSSRRNSSR